MCRRSTARCWSSSAAAIAALLVLGWAGSARAHQASMSYAQIDVSADHTRVDVQLRVNMNDMAEPMGLPVDTVPSDDQLLAARKQVFDYVLARVGIETDGHACPVERGPLTVVDDGDRFAQLTWSAACPRPFAELAVEYHLFFDIDALHTGNLRVRADGEVAVAPIGNDARRFSWHLGDAAPTSYLAFVRMGVEHIVFGFDHVCFLIGLLLVSVVARPRGRSWELRGVGGAVRYTAAIVTSFTIAHSFTLAAAALGWITLPGKLVESMIAVSIIYVAVENVVSPEPARRWIITFGFGLIHGLGFASVLHLPPDEVVAPLLFFNLGVELGQLAIVILLVPVLHVLAGRVLGAQDYRRLAVTVGSAAIGVLAALWLVERLFELKLL